MKPKEPMQAGMPAAPATGEAFVALEERALLDANAWIEHLEEEIEPTCSADSKEDLDLVRKNSPEDAAIVASLTRVRTAVASLKSDVAMPESGAYYDALHAKIMAAIDDDIALNGEPERKPASVAKKRRPVLLSSMFGALGMTMMVAILAIVGQQSHFLARTPTASLAQADAARETVVEENFERKIAMVDSHSGATFARDMGSFESEEDFLTETAAARLKQVSAKQAEAMLRSLRR